LFDVCNGHIATVNDMAERIWRVSFRRWMDEEMQEHIRKVLNILMRVALNASGQTGNGPN
jgi:hypothetical protein